MSASNLSSLEMLVGLDVVTSPENMRRRCDLVQIIRQHMQYMAMGFFAEIAEVDLSGLIEIAALAGQLEAAFVRHLGLCGLEGSAA